MRLRAGATTGARTLGATPRSRWSGRRRRRTRWSSPTRASTCTTPTRTSSSPSPSPSPSSPKSPSLEAHHHNHSPSSCWRTSTARPNKISPPAHWTLPPWLQHHHQLLCAILTICSKSLPFSRRSCSSSTSPMAGCWKTWCRCWSGDPAAAQGPPPPPLAAAPPRRRRSWHRHRTFPHHLLSHGTPPLLTSTWPFSPTFSS